MACSRHYTLCLFHSLIFVVAFRNTLLVLGLFIPFVLELLVAYSDLIYYMFIGVIV